MVSLIIGFIAVILFTVCAHFFAKSLFKPLPSNIESPYSKQALRIGQGYYRLSMGIMTFVFLSGVIVSFIQIYSEL